MLRKKEKKNVLPFTSSDVGGSAYRSHGCVVGDRGAKRTNGGKLFTFMSYTIFSRSSLNNLYR